MTPLKKTVNREISWLSFNERVLQEAMDVEVPLVERFRFLGIFSNNLDEFFKVRVASIKRMIDVETSTGIMSGENPKKILNEIQKKVIFLQERFEQTYRILIGELAKSNIFYINEKQMNPEQEIFARQYFHDHILSVITPVMLHNIKSFPQLKDKSIYFAIKLTRKGKEGLIEYALLEIPVDRTDRFLVLPSEGKKKYIMILDDLIRFCLDDIFDIFHFDKFEAYTIKLTRDAELDIDNDLSKSFLEKIDESVSDRKEGQLVRFVFDYNMPLDLLDFLINKLDLDDDDNLIPGGRYHNFKDYMSFPNLGGKKLEYKPTPPNSHPLIKPHHSILKVMAGKDILLHFPYQKFDHYINLLREAAIDPDVESIYITLYRVSRDSKVINALSSAAMNGKKVTVVIELQARFDEKSNIYWSRRLEEAGAQVIFGKTGLKVHCKLCLITRREGRNLVRYGSIGTGNFHEGTAAVYSDLTLLTADKRITQDIEKVFMFFNTSYKPFKFKHLLVSPLYMRKKFNSLINNEIKNSQEGKDAYILIKINSLVDTDIITKLYQANAAGVKIKGIIRGICSIIPGVTGLSENIEIISIVDKFLEHTRVFVFCNNNKELYYLSSADWMPRNLDNRVEIACPVLDPDLQKEIKTMMKMQFRDNVKARVINADQDNQYKKSHGERKVRSQTELYKYYSSLASRRD